MLSVSLGPLALPVAPLLLLAALWLASALARRLAGPALAGPAGDAVLGAALVGLLGARAGHVLLQPDLYLGSAPALLNLADLRDGGWQTATGLASGAAWLAWRGWRAAALRRALAGAGCAGLALWLAGGWALERGQPPALPTEHFIPLDGGQRLSLAQAARGRPVVLNLWASWCGPCRQEMPLLAAAQQRDPGIAFLFVNQGEAAATVRAYLAQQRLPLRDLLLDPPARLGPALGSHGLPTTLFYDETGRRIDAHFGVLSAASLEARLRRLRGHTPPGQPPAPPAPPTASPTTGSPP